MKTIILRLGHRYCRDERLSTHVALTARALGASEIIYDAKDSKVEQSVEAINNAWGGDFKVSHTESWKKTVKEFKGEVIHLTMYGLNLNKEIGKIKKSKKDKMIVIGSQKVPPEMYQLADYNISVGSQPHSEVAALAVFLDRLYDKKELEFNFKGRKTIKPQAKGKLVTEER